MQGPAINSRQVLMQDGDARCVIEASQAKPILQTRQGDMYI